MSSMPTRCARRWKRLSQRSSSTPLPRCRRASSPRSDYLAATNRVRSEGTRNLVAAARAAGARRIVAESIAFFYEPEGGWVKDEEAPLFVDPPGRFAPARDALAELESQVSGAADLEGVVLRFGWFYGPGTHFGRGGSQAEETLKRRNPIVGVGAGRFSFVHVEDAAAAAAAALEGGGPGVYNVVDDDPAPQREWLPVYADALGAKPPRRVPGWLAGLVVGRDLARTAWRCAAPRTRRQSASSAGSRRTRAGVRAFASRWVRSLWASGLSGTVLLTAVFKCSLKGCSRRESDSYLGTTRCPSLRSNRGSADLRSAGEGGHAQPAAKNRPVLRRCPAQLLRPASAPPATLLAELHTSRGPCRRRPG